MVRFFLLFCCFFAANAFAQEPPSTKTGPEVVESTPSTPSEQNSQEMVESTQPTYSDEMLPAPMTYKGAFAKMMLTLFGLIALIVITVWMLRRISHGRLKQMNYGRSIKILERRPLSAKSILYLIEVDGKKVVVSESQLDVRMITTADHLLPEE